MKPSAQARRQSPGAAGATVKAQKASTGPKSDGMATESRSGLKIALRTPRRAKFGNRKASLDGYVFASQLEGKRYVVLRERLRAGEITDLAVHPAFALTVNGVLIGRYTADFSYTVTSTGARIVEDVKSKATITESYKLRKKLMWACHRIRVVEVLAA